MPPDLSAWFGLLSSFALRSSVKLRASIARSRQLLRSASDSAKKLACEWLVHAIVLLLFTYCTMALPKHKTCLSILRSILGPGAGNEARFAEKIGRSASWLKKASCGQIPLTRDAAIAIAYETGASMKWLFDGDTTKPLLDSEGKPYTLETYVNHRAKDREDRDWEDVTLAKNEVVGCFFELLRVLGAANLKNRGGLFSYHLGHFADEMAAKFGKANINKNKKAAQIAETVADLIMMDHSDDVVVVDDAPAKKPKPTPKPQKKQPSRKSKRPA
jgi:hypothetical protein